jgi:predicted metalloprotease
MLAGMKREDTLGLKIYNRSIASKHKGDNMRWTPGGTSGDIEDRRDDGGGGGGFGFGGMHIGIGGMIILLILSFVFKRNFFALLGGGASSAISEPDRARDASEEPTVKFVSFVLDDAQQTWAGILQQQGIPYRHAKLVLFRDATTSGCGSARSATGPFYCPADEKVYIDLGFFDELKRSLWRAGRVCSGLRPCPRTRASCAETDRS